MKIVFRLFTQTCKFSLQWKEMKAECDFLKVRDETSWVFMSLLQCHAENYRMLSRLLIHQRVIPSHLRFVYNNIQRRYIAHRSVCHKIKTAHRQGQRQNYEWSKYIYNAGPLHWNPNEMKWLTELGLPMCIQEKRKEKRKPEHPYCN